MLPISLEMTNFQCYEHERVNFDFSSALIIGERDENTEVSNGSGKSTIFEAIAWALYGKSRQRSADGVVKRGLDYCEVEFVFEHDGKKYKVIRKRNKRFSKLECLLFEINSNGLESPIPGDTNTEINEKIQEITKSNYDVFANSCYFRQSTLSDFLNGTAATKQKIISSILNLDRWNKYLKESKSHLDNYKIEKGKIDFALKGSEDIYTNLADAKIQLKDAREESNELISKEKRLLDEIGDLEKKASDLKTQEVELNNYHETVTKLETLSDRQKDLKNTVLEKTSEVDSICEKISRSDLSVSQLEAKIEEISSYVEIDNHIDIDHLERQLVSKQTDLNWYKKQIEDWKPKEICKCCGDTWDTHTDRLAEYEENTDKKKNLDKEVLLLSDKLDAAKEVLRKVKQTELEIEKYTSRKKNLESGIEINTLKKEAAETELSHFVEQLEEANQKVKELQDRVDGMKEIAESNSFDKIRNMIKQKKDEYEALSDKKNKNFYLVGGLTQKVEEYTKQGEERKRLEVELKKVNRDISICDNLHRSFGRSGIQAIIIDNVMEELTKVVNEWLNEFCYEPTYVRFITQKKDSKGGWKETLEVEVITPSGSCDFESLSGGEGFRVAFAIRLGLSQIQARRMGGETQILLLDEVSTSLDAHGLDIFVTIIKKIEKDMKVMVVTHDDKLKDKFSHVICVKRSGTNSTIQMR